MYVDNLSENVVPTAEAYFNVRFNSKHKSSLLKKLNRIISTLLKKINVNLKLIIEFQEAKTEPNKEIDMVKVIKKTTNTYTKLNCRGGTSDSRFLGSIPRLELGLKNNTIHMVDEKTQFLI